MQVMWMVLVTLGLRCAGFWGLRWCLALPRGPGS